MENDPEQKQAFDDYIKSRRLGSQWFDIYPVATKFANARKDAGAILLDDIGGGPGQEVDLFRQRYPDIPGLCVLQNLPLTIERIDKLHEGIERMAYNFFEPQPVKGTNNTTTHRISVAAVKSNCARRSLVLPPECLAQLVGRPKRQNPVACGRSHGS